MDVFDFAIQMEKDGYQFYQEQSRRLEDPAARNMMISLAEDEKRHEQTLRQMKQGRLGLVKGEVMPGMKNVFQTLVDEGRGFDNEQDSLTKVLQKALGMERDSISMYFRLAEKAETGEEQAVWKALEAEEHRHAKVIGLAIEYIENPATVLEDAEFQFYGHEGTP
ncbi:MAG: ferritin family protein [Sedimentisphaerales bacterium]|nr:ferritin family protein [Sedimentisphaerales bacterium]